MLWYARQPSDIIIVPGKIILCGKDKSIKMADKNLEKKRNSRFCKRGN
jgi:hypothetical protein